MILIFIYVQYLITLSMEKEIQFTVLRTLGSLIQTCHSSLSQMYRSREDLAGFIRTTNIPVQMLYQPSITVNFKKYILKFINCNNKSLFMTCHKCRRTYYELSKCGKLQQAIYFLCTFIETSETRTCCIFQDINFFTFWKNRGTSCTHKLALCN